MKMNENGQPLHRV